jgi:hypothetical protein
MKFYRNEIKLGKEKKVLITCNHHENNEAKIVKEIGNFHHIHVIDRSGSMQGSIAELIEDVIATFSLMGPNDIVSVLWFSSENQQGVILKGAKNDPSLKEVLRKYKSTVGMTCFSQPMEMVKSIIDELSPMCSNIVVNFFTDGMPVVSWGSTEEFKRTHAIVESFSHKIISMNTIGYGQYYSQQFLRDLAGLTQYGQFVHASNIRDYQKIFDTNYQIVKENILDKVEIEAPGIIIYLNRKTTKCSGATAKLELTSLDNNKNQFFILMNMDTTCLINGEKIESSSILNKASDATIQNFYYALAYNMYYDGTRSEALEVIVKNIGNGYLADRQLSAWTFDEVSDYESILFQRTINPESRKNDTPCKSNYLPKDNAFCFMDMMLLLSRDGALYLPYHSESEDYERIGKKAEYVEFGFHRDNSKIPSASFSNVVFTKDRCNIGLKFQIAGYVDIKPEHSKNISKIDCSIFRTHNLILDGYPNLKSIVVCMSSKLYNKLLTKKVDVVYLEDGDGEDTSVICKINLCSIPVINKKMSEGNTGSSILHLIEEQIEHETNIKVIGSLIEQLGKSKAKKFSEYTTEESLLLDRYGIDKSGVYRGIGLSQKKNDACDYYISKNVEFSLQGFKKIPSVNEYLKRVAAKKDMKGCITLIHEAYEKFIKLPLAQLETQLINEQDLLRDVKYELSIIKMSLILTGSWIPDFKKNDNGEFIYTDSLHTAEMCISEEKQYF